MGTQVGIVSSTKTKTRPINIAQWVYWQWRYEQAIAKAQKVVQS